MCLSGLRRRRRARGSGRDRGRRASSATGRIRWISGRRESQEEEMKKKAYTGTFGLEVCGPEPGTDLRGFVAHASRRHFGSEEDLLAWNSRCTDRISAGL